MKKLQIAAVFGMTLGFGLACGGMDMDTASLYVPPPSVGGAASAACPPGAASGKDFSPGAKLTLVAIHPDDAYFGPDVLGRLPEKGKVGSGDLTVTEGCWYGGEFEADNGNSYYFYMAAFTEG
ncbi:MAG: hypothetical protein EP330_07965 [Deltaproteobacteria bacterium]|nr:MAG: hypothetical protein EP330_07965 [Deltaproteobacteria bacterium]